MKVTNPLTENFYKNIFDNLDQALIVIDENLYVHEMNDSAEEVFKISRNKARGNKTDYFLPAEIEQLALKSLEENRVVQGNEIDCKLRGGKTLTLLSNSIPIFTQGKSSKSVILQIKDMSLTKFLTQKSIQEQTNSMFENLILGLCHELKNPLSGIKGASQILIGELDTEDNKKTASIIVKEIDRLTAMIDNFNHLQLFSDEIFEDIDIHEIISEITFMEEKSIKAKNISFINDFDVTIPHISADMHSLKQAFINIIKNAIEAVNKKTGSIKITTRWNTVYKLRGEPGIYIDIKDNGPGISKNQLGKIFSPFFTTKKKGTGLGLFFTQQIINKHGGHIHVESEPEVGSTFTVFLPATKTGGNK
ncbi:MAG: PAS domain S-box protein [Candidatus Dadabacteria bacterium]|nr:PAS domain S-box protein [Candidatus Dadabacteria bacterium]NIX15677.1 PAS domain S-box protein [Candidatus Dadabacteria bacterium]NIY22219.1 PAS domain S-box protein [Candidatus Dadabacteria bacterium]